MSDDEIKESGKSFRPTWRVWAVTIIIAIVLSVTATLLLSGSSSYRMGRATAGSDAGCCASGDARGGASGDCSGIANK